jgi:DNA-3-methyladenine glycosylase
MLNAVTGKPGEGAAVLIRSCDVVDGLDEVMQRRKTMRTTALCNGPGKVGQALAICKAISGHPLFELGGLELRDGPPPAAIERAVRVGIGYAAEKDRNALMRFLGTGISA